MNPSISGIIASVSNSGYGSPAAAARRSSTIAAGPSSIPVGFAPHTRSMPVSTRRLVALSSTTSTRRPCNFGDVAAVVSVASDSARAKFASKWNVLPRPASLSIAIRPPIKATSRDEIVRPRPVPPKRRVVEPSACENGSKMSCCFSGGTPIPVSATSKCNWQPFGV
jgi:hypothetical protein